MDDQDRPNEPDDGPRGRNDGAERTHRRDAERTREADADRTRRADANRTRGNETAGDSVIDLAQRPIVKAWTTYLTLLFALVAAGFGLFGILRDAIGEGIVDTGSSAAGFGAAFEVAFSIPLTTTPYLGILIAVFAGAFLGWRLEHDRSTTYVVAGLGMGVATFVFWVLTALFGSIPLDNISLDIGGLLVNAILAGITAGIVAAGGVWATRTRAPAVLTDSRRTPRAD